MMAGPRPFFIEDGQLQLALRPILPGWLFDDENQVTFTFLGHCAVTYQNPSKRNTFEPGTKGSQITLHLDDGRNIDLEGDIIPSPYAKMVRDGLIRKITQSYQT